MRSVFKNLIMFLLGFGTVFYVTAQELVVQAFLPQSALIQKEQLWNLMITNPFASPQSGKVSLNIVNKRNGQKVLTALSNSILIPGGAKLYQVADMMPVLYNSLSNDVNLNELGFLPVGEYQVCYELVNNKGVRSGISCIDAKVDILTPPQLIFPENKANISPSSPAFSWIPPSPAQLMNNCTYSFKVVSVNQNQMAVDAINDNVPIYQVSGLPSSFLNYPAFAPILEEDKVFAWQIRAHTSSADIESDVWQFTTNKDGKQNLLGSDGSAYTKLEKAGTSINYSIVSHYLQFSFLNESQDSVFQFQIFDVTDGKHAEVKVDSESIPKFLQGNNIVKIELAPIGNFKKGRMYALVLTDRQRQEWKMMFQYRNAKK